MRVTTDILKLIQQRQSTRVVYHPRRPVAREEPRQIIEAGRWAPTAHNMQNFEVVVVDDKILEKIGNVKSQVSEAFIRKYYQLLSFSEEELLRSARE
jgi:nitroreductase